MHGLDPATTVLTAALALMTAFALASETPLAGGRGRVAVPVHGRDVPFGIASTGDGWVALNASGFAALPSFVTRSR